MLKSIKLWLEAARAPFFTATIVPIALGAAIAWYSTGAFNTALFLLTLIGGIFIHAGLDLSNDYFDHRSGADEFNRNPTPFSGGSRMIQKGVLTPASMLAGAVICFAAGAITGLYLNYLAPGNVILIIGLAGMFLAVFYTAGPVKIGYRGAGEAACAIGFGPLMVLGAYYVQAGSISMLPVYASVPVAVLIALVLLINEFPDRDPDREAGKNTLVVIMGKKAAVKLYFISIAFVYLWPAAGVLLGVFPAISLIVFITLPISLKAARTAAGHYDKIKELIPAAAATIALHLVYGLLLAASFILARLYFSAV